jgi:hypothetical protein
MILPTFRFAGRSLLRSPGFTLLAVITLGLGIGANTAMFSVLNSLMLKPLPYPKSAELDRIDRATAQTPTGRVSPADFLDLQRERQGYGEVAGYSLGDTSLSEPGQPAEMVRAMRTTTNLFATLRVQPQLGRDFLPRESLPGNDRVVIVSQRCWQNRFGGRADVIGQTIRLSNESYTVIGVMPASFEAITSDAEVIVPIAFTAERLAQHDEHYLDLYGRRRADVSQAQVNGELMSLQQQRDELVNAEIPGFSGLGVEGKRLVNTATLVIDHAGLTRFFELTGHVPEVVSMPARG